jgi:hypothetical protein
MYQPIQFKAKILSVKNSINRSPSRYGFLLIALACFALSPATQAQLSPPPDGGYPNNNTAEGTDALFSLTTGTDNTAIGFDALYSNTGGGGAFGNFNTAVGFQALFSNTTAIANTANGVQALYRNTTGSFNTANGVHALFINTTGRLNTANGNQALENNTTGEANTATGVLALNRNTTGGLNTATGLNALFNNSTGAENTANGQAALSANTTGSANIAVGSNAGRNLTTGSNNIDTGNAGVAAEANTIRIGTQGTQTKTFIAGITAAAVQGVAVKVNADGQLGVPPSSKRFKTDIKPMDKSSEAILALKPVTFRYKKEIDAAGTPEFGLVAEDVAKVNPDLVVRDAEGKVYTVRYDAVNAMLLNEFLKEHQTVQELKSAAAKQEAMIAGQQKQIAALTAGLQKVSAQLEVSKSAPQTVLNNQ